MSLVIHVISCHYIGCCVVLEKLQKLLIWAKKRTGLDLLSGTELSFKIKVNFAHNLKIKVPESGGKCREAQNLSCLKFSVKFHSL